MLKTKFISGHDMEDLERKLNRALEDIEEKPNIRYYESSWVAVIEMEIVPEYVGRLCCDCAFWDDTGNSSLSCFCTQNGKRMRYYCRACKLFKDLRDNER